EEARQDRVIPAVLARPDQDIATRSLRAIWPSSAPADRRRKVEGDGGFSGPGRAGQQMMLAARQPAVPQPVDFHGLVLCRKFEIDRLAFALGLRCGLGLRLLLPAKRIVELV